MRQNHGFFFFLFDFTAKAQEISSLENISASQINHSIILTDSGPLISMQTGQEEWVIWT